MLKKINYANHMNMSALFAIFAFPYTPPRLSTPPSRPLATVTATSPPHCETGIATFSSLWRGTSQKWFENLLSPTWIKLYKNIFWCNYWVCWLQVLFWNFIWFVLLKFGSLDNSLCSICVYEMGQSYYVRCEHFCCCLFWLGNNAYKQKHR